MMRHNVWLFSKQQTSLQLLIRQDCDRTSPALPGNTLDQHSQGDGAVLITPNDIYHCSIIVFSVSVCIEQLFKKNKEQVSNFRAELTVLVFHQDDANSCFQQIHNDD